MRYVLFLRLAAALASLVAGGAVGCSVVVLHSRWWGLLLGLAATAAMLAAVPGDWWRRFPLALGWVGCVFLLARSRPEGDFLIAGDWFGYAVLTAAVAVLIVGAVSLLPERQRAADDSGVTDRSS